MNRISIQRFGNGLANEKVRPHIVERTRNKRISYVRHPIDIPLPYGRDLDIYANMMSKFLSQGGNVSTAFVEIDLEENKYTCVLWGDSGNKFLFSTRNLDLQKVRTIWPGPSKAMMVSTFGLPSAIQSERFQRNLDGVNNILDLEDLMRPINFPSHYRSVERDYTPEQLESTLNTVTTKYAPFESMDCIRPVKMTLQAPSVSRSIPNDRYCQSVNRRELTSRDPDPLDGYIVPLTHMSRVVTGGTVTGYGVNDQFVQNVVALTNEVDSNSHAFSVGYGTFSIPLIASSNRNEGHFTAYQLLSREGLLDSTEEEYYVRNPVTSVILGGPINTRHLTTEEMGFEFQKGSVFLNFNKLVFDDRLSDDSFVTTGLRMMPVLDNTEPCLDWVSPTTAVREPVDSIWDLMKVTHLIEQSKGTLGTWFKGVSKYQQGGLPRGYLRLECEGNRAIASVINTAAILDAKEDDLVKTELVIANETTVTTNPVQSEDVPVTSCLDYYTYDKWVGSRHRLDMSIGRLMSPTDSELIGIDNDGRFLFGIATESGTNCMITMNSVTKMAPPVGNMSVPEQVAQNPEYQKWLRFTTEYCNKRDCEVDVSLDNVFRTYINSGLLTQEDVDTYNRLK